MNMEFACTLKSRLRGLLGRGDFVGVLLIVPCHDIHTFGMKRAIDVAFVSSDGLVIESYLAVGPRRRIRCRKAAVTLERYAVDAPWLEVGDRIELQTKRRNS
ncbi:MAG: DUF192 domain-containing protein [Eggerthellaceae bacterium]|nr:DUF192 domain-containing protein [Eggerthellaceae bacterium]